GRSHVTREELRLELACALYARGRISAVTGSHLAGVDLLTFQDELMQREIPRNCTVNDLYDDVEALKKLFPEWSSSRYFGHSQSLPRAQQDLLPKLFHEVFI